MSVVSTVLSYIAVFFVSVGFLFGLVPQNGVKVTPMKDREYACSEVLPVSADGKYVRLEAKDEGTDMFVPDKQTGGYRYGPTIFSNADGSLDVFFAAPGCFGRWDVINYRHSPDGGKTWTTDKKILEPTPGSPDLYSCCDPGAVKFGGYWYIGYTSTVDSRGVFNHVFVARSRNIDGPYEKWNGSGWGGDPAPVVTFTGGADEWGAGEPSFTVADGTLYMYYTWKTSANETRVCTADASDENWPASLNYRGTAITYRDMNSDSADVKYIDEYGRFVAVCTGARFSPYSYIDVYQSDDGLSFTRSCVVRTNIAACCHNCGISSRTDGHIRLADKKYIGYAYGSDWGNWATRLNEISISLADSPCYSDFDVMSRDIPVEGVSHLMPGGYVGIFCENDMYECSVGRPAVISPYCLTDGGMTVKLGVGVKYGGYDGNVIKIAGGLIIPVAAGKTDVTVSWGGFTTQIKVSVN